MESLAGRTMPNKPGTWRPGGPPGLSQTAAVESAQDVGAWAIRDMLVKTMFLPRGVLRDIFRNIALEPYPCVHMVEVFFSCVGLPISTAFGQHRSRFLDCGQIWPEFAHLRGHCRASSANLAYQCSPDVDALWQTVVRHLSPVGGH